MILIGKNSQNYQALYVIKKNFFFCMHKMFDFLTIKTTSEIWVSMKDVGSGMGVKNISDLVLKEIYGICETKNPTKKTS